MSSTVVLPKAVVTKALRGVEHQLPGAFEEVWHLVYQWVVRRGETLLLHDALRFSITAEDLAHEAFLRIRPAHVACCRDRWHLLRIVARSMRQVLWDLARRRRSAPRIEVDHDALAACSARPKGGEAHDLLDLAAAMAELRGVNELLCEVAELRHLAGLTFLEVGTAFGRGEAWARACASRADNWLSQRLRR